MFTRSGNSLITVVVRNCTIMQLFWRVLILYLLKSTLAEECSLCESGGLKRKWEINETILEGVENLHGMQKRFIDPTFRGNPKSKGEIWNEKFKGNNTNFAQANSLVALLNKIAVEYLHKCAPYVLYDSYVENSEFAIVQTLFQTFPLTFYHGKINENFKLSNSKLITKGDTNCRSYILFLSDPQKTRSIIGPQMDNKVIVVARSSQWKLQAFLSSEESSDIVNLLVIGESLTADPKRERPYVLYTHHLYSDGLGSNVPVVLTSWIKGSLSRPHVNLFPAKYAKGFAGHRFLIAAANQPPFIFRRKFVDNTGNLNVYWEGLEYRLIKLLSQRLNFSFEIVEPRNINQLGSGEAVREEVELGRADIGMAGAYITQDRLEEIDMSVGHSRDCAAFITLASKALPKYRAIMGPFQWPVWVALTAVYLLGIFPLAYTDRLSLSHLIGNFGEIENMFWYVFGTFTNSLTFTGKYSWSGSRKSSTRLLIGFYWIFTIIVTSCYTGSIIAFVTLPAFPDTVDSVYDLLGLFFRVGTLDRGGWERWFANSTHEPTELLYRKMEFVRTLEEGIGNVTQSFFWNYAFLGSRSQLEYLVQSNFTNDAMSKRSALHLSEECFAPFQVALTFPKNSVYARKINEGIMRLQQSGLINKLLNEVSWKMQRSSTGKLLQATSGANIRDLNQEERQLTTADTEGMFLLMAAGYTIAVLALISEIIGGFTNKCRQIMKRARKSIASEKSSIASSCGSRSSLNKPTANKSQKHDSTKQRNNFPGLSELNLTRETLKELYGGYNKKESTLIVQNGRVIFETEAISENSLSSASCNRNDHCEQIEGDDSNVRFSEQNDSESDSDFAVDNEETGDPFDKFVNYDQCALESQSHLERIPENSTEGTIYGEPETEDPFGETLDHGKDQQPRRFYPFE